jgi:hypothetical protein
MDDCGALGKLNSILNENDNATTRHEANEVWLDDSYLVSYLVQLLRPLRLSDFHRPTRSPQHSRQRHHAITRHSLGTTDNSSKEITETFTAFLIELDREDESAPAEGGAVAPN